MPPFVVPLSPAYHFLQFVDLAGPSLQLWRPLVRGRQLGHRPAPSQNSCFAWFRSAHMLRTRWATRLAAPWPWPLGAGLLCISRRISHRRIKLDPSSCGSDCHAPRPMSLPKL